MADDSPMTLPGSHDRFGLVESRCGAVRVEWPCEPAPPKRQTRSLREILTALCSSPESNGRTRESHGSTSVLTLVATFKARLLCPSALAWPWGKQSGGSECRGPGLVFVQRKSRERDAGLAGFVRNASVGCER